MIRVAFKHWMRLRLTTIPETLDLSETFLTGSIPLHAFTHLPNLSTYTSVTVSMIVASGFCLMSADTLVSRSFLRVSRAAGDRFIWKNTV